MRRGWTSLHNEINIWKDCADSVYLKENFEYLDYKCADFGFICPDLSFTCAHERLKCPSEKLECPSVRLKCACERLTLAHLKASFSKIDANFWFDRANFSRLKAVFRRFGSMPGKYDFAENNFNWERFAIMNSGLCPLMCGKALPFRQRFS